MIFFCFDLKFILAQFLDSDTNTDQLISQFNLALVCELCLVSYQLWYSSIPWESVFIKKVSIALNTMDVQKIYIAGIHIISHFFEAGRKLNVKTGLQPRVLCVFFWQYETSAFNLNQRSIILLCNQNKLIHLFLFICINLVKEMRRKAVVRNWWPEGWNLLCC